MPLRIGQDARAWDHIDALLVQPRSPVPPAGWNRFPLGCLALADHLSAVGYRVALWDLQHDPEASDDTLRNLLSDCAVRLAGISVLSTTLRAGREIAGLIRDASPSTRIVVGGQHVSEATADTFPEADLLVKGEGELALERLLADGDEGGKAAGCGARLIEGEPLPQFAARPPISAEVFRTYQRFAPFERLGLMVSRGCPYRCTFCHFDGRSRRVREYDPSLVGQLLETAQSETGVGAVFFLDDVFTLSRDWVMEVVAEIHRRRLTGLRYSSFTHVGLGDRELYRAMAQAGFVQVQIGIESGHPAVRRRMHKHFSNEEARRLVDTIRDCGMEANCLFMLGYAGETVASMRETLAFADSLPATLWFSMAQPLPGTVFLEEAEAEGTILTRDYSEYCNNRIVYLPAGVSLEEMQGLQRDAEALRVVHAERFQWRPSTNGLATT